MTVNLDWVPTDATREQLQRLICGGEPTVYVNALFQRLADLESGCVTKEPRFPKDHPAVCYQPCDPAFEITPHIHTPSGVYIVDLLK